MADANRVALREPERRGSTTNLDMRLLEYDRYRTSYRSGKSIMIAQRFAVRVTMADRPRDWVPPYWPIDSKRRTVQIGVNRLHAEQCFEMDSGTGCVAVARKVRTWEEHHGSMGPIADPAETTRMMEAALALAKKGQKVLLIGADRHSQQDERRMNLVVGEAADDTTRLEFHHSRREQSTLLEVALPRWRFSPGGWLVLAPRDALARAEKWCGAIPENLVYTPAVLDWFSCPFPVAFASEKVLDNE